MCKYIADDLGEEDYEYEWDPEWKMHEGEENDDTNSDNDCNDAEDLEGECVYLPRAHNFDNIILSRRLAYLDFNKVIASSTSLCSIDHQMPLPVPNPEIKQSLIYISYQIINIHFISNNKYHDYFSKARRDSNKNVTCR